MPPSSENRVKLASLNAKIQKYITDRKFSYLHLPPNIAHRYVQFTLHNNQNYIKLLRQRNNLRALMNMPSVPKGTPKVNNWPSAPKHTPSFRK